MVAKSLLDASTERETQLVEPEAYLRLITSRRRLVRADDETQGLLGLLDLDSRVRFVVDAREVMDALRGRRELTEN
jgi:hypothetical protein